MLDPFSQEKKEKNNNNNKKIYINRLIPYNSKKINNQHKIIINNIELFFPFSPHEIQIIFMKKILHNLNQRFLLKEKYKAIAALESPAGTGKTLCLLCATLAWVNDMRKTNNYKGKIIYTAKSYDKISHIINELNKTYYKPRICVLFSPYNACINNNINNSKNDKLIYMKCKNSFENCEYYNNREIYNLNNINDNEDDYLDIEDLSEFACDKKTCPFFYEKNSINGSDIIFMPSEFLFDSYMKKILEININDNIIIIDEAHNLTKLCQEVNSISINTNDLEEIILEMKKLSENIELSINNKIGKDEINCEILAINKVINNINNNKLNILQGEVYPDKGMLLDSKDFLSLFLTKNIKNGNSSTSNLEIISLENINRHIYVLKYIQKLFYVNFEKNNPKLSVFIYILEKINTFYINQFDNSIDSYIFFLSYIKNPDVLRNNLIRKLNIYCFDPSLSFKKLIAENPYAIFLSSDSLEPFNILENELKLSFDMKLVNEHIIQNEQYKFSIVQSSLYNGEKIIFQLDYLHRSNVKMVIALGYTLLSLCHTNQYGSILVYFPSMAYLNQCSLIWKDNKIIDKLQEINNIYYSQKSLKKLKKIRNEKNYIFFVVFDKNTSPEEIFFRECNITMVICLGIPYDIEYSFDDKIQLKIKYLDDKIKTKYQNDDILNYKIKDELTGEKWYEKNAIYIINRFLGKSLKLLSGYGSLICIDKRYASALNNGLFSTYLKNNCELVNIENSSYFESLLSFFGKIKNNYSSSFNFFNAPNDSIYFKKKGKNIQYNDEDEDSENYFLNKKYKTKIFDIPNKDKNQIEIEHLFNNTKKLEELILNPKKLNRFLNDSNLAQEEIKAKNFLQKKKLKDKDDDSSEEIEDKNEEDEDENKNNAQNVKKKNKKTKKHKKMKKEEEELPNKNTTFKNFYNFDGNNIFQNFCQEYDKKEEKEVKDEKNINIQNNENENVNDANNNEMNLEKEIEPDPEILQQLNNNTYTVNSSEVYECPICFKSSANNTDLIYSMSKCRHVLCNICWSEWLIEKLECPLCKGKARPKTLKRIIFTK